MDVTPKKPRQRASRLTEDAVLKLEAALLRAWDETCGDGPLTWVARAGLLNVSVNTARAILTRKGNDKAVLVQAFRQVGLPWRECECEFSPTDFGSVCPPSQSFARQLRNRFWPAILVLIGVAAVLLAISWPMDSLRPANTRAQRLADIAAAGIAYNHADYQTAKRLALRAVSYARVSSDASALAQGLSLVGQALSAEGRLEEAVDRYKTSLKVWEAFEDSEGQAYLCALLGVAEARIQKLGDAESHFRQSLHLYEQIKQSGGVAMAARGLGSAAAISREYDVAFRWYDLAEKHLPNKPNDPLRIDVKALRALIKSELGRQNEALKDLEQCLRFWKKENHVRWIATTYYQIGLVQSAAGNKGGAWNSVREAESRFESVGDIIGKQACAMLLSAKPSESDKARTRIEAFF